MKRIIILFFLLASFNCFSQKIKLGINGGLNYSEIKGMEVTHYDYSGKIGFAAGISAEYFLTKSWSLKADLAFERKSNKAKYSFTELIFADPSAFGTKYTVKVWNNLDFLTLPVLLKYNFGKQKSYFVNAGPYIAYLLNAKHIVDSNHDPENNFSSNDDATASFNRYDAGLTIGLGKVFKLDGSDLAVEFRSNVGLKNINKYEDFYGESFETLNFGLIANWSFDWY
ncbi:porin family protein [Flavobacterium sp. 3HN19-14]|uniref:porin family protein n=1 Tax=Flavobacterium sp. 3HN19-14 TaxID=3448133 RepID=UPI003EE19718